MLKPEGTRAEQLPRQHDSKEQAIETAHGVPEASELRTPSDVCVELRHLIYVSCVISSMCLVSCDVCVVCLVSTQHSISSIMSALHRIYTVSTPLLHRTYTVSMRAGALNHLVCYSNHMCYSTWSSTQGFKDTNSNLNAPLPMPL